MQTVQVTYLDGETVEAEVKQLDYVRFERSRDYIADRPVLALWWTAWSALGRTGKARLGGAGKALSFDGWTAQVDEVEPLDEEEEPDPTQPAPPAESASGSRSRSARTRSGSSGGTTTGS